MAKTEKKKNRKLRRRIRRTTAVILLITSIIVAAIPVPENVAAPGDPTTPDPDRLPSAYAYDVDVPAAGAVGTDDVPAAELFGTVNLDSSKVSDADKFKGYNVFKFSGDAEYTYQYQYDLYTTKAGDIICGYNDRYVQGAISITNHLYKEYEIITDAQLAAFEASRMADDFTITMTDPTTVKGVGVSTENGGVYTYVGPNAKWWQKNGTEASGSVPVETWRWLLQNLTALKGDYAAYEKRYNDYMNSEAGKLNPNGWYTTANELTLHFNGLTDDDKFRYYCEVSRCSLYTTTLAGCKLVRVVNEDPDTAGQTGAYIYIPQVVDTSRVQAGIIADSNEKVENGKEGGFVCGDPTGSIVGIANDVFKGIRSITSLSLPSNLHYIGNSAFEDSFIQSVTAEALHAIGNRAFKGCTALSSFKFTSDRTMLKTIGTEAFQGSALTDFEIPCTVEQIAPGAFASCASLSKVTMAKGTHNPCVIEKFAFYDCAALSTVDWGDGVAAVYELGKAAFAMPSGAGSMTSFTFPEGSTAHKLKLGDYILAGRGELAEAFMPCTNWGYGEEVTIPPTTFVNCFGLGYVDFTRNKTASSPYAGGRIYYDPEKLFIDVTNPDLYVRGPKFDSSGRVPATPRKSTWDAVTAVSTTVPYVYSENGKDYYEISDGYYLESIDSTGVLQSCIFKPGTTEAEKQEFMNGPNAGKVTIPSKVGNIETTAIADGSFSNDDIKQYIKEIEFEDDSKIVTIGKNVFSDSPNLSSVIIGNTIKNIGDGAFANCGTKITSGAVNVEFHSPAGGDYAGFKIGKDAFTTGGKPLIFNGDVVKGYAPFEHAMDPNTKVNTEGLRICYKSLRPQNLIVMQDGETNAPTLVDYPRYDEINEVNAELIKEIQDAFVETYSTPDYDDKRAEYATDPTEENDGPWNGQDYFKREPYDIIDAYENGDQYASKPWKQITVDGRAVVEATLYIDIPDGVTSIDVVDYFTDAVNNGLTYSTYDCLKDARLRYLQMPPEDSEDAEKEFVQGLFSGWFPEEDLEVTFIT